jgi:hypothetical protein
MPRDLVGVECRGPSLRTPDPVPAGVSETGSSTNQMRSDGKGKQSQEAKLAQMWFSVQTSSTYLSDAMDKAFYFVSFTPSSFIRRKLP